MQDDLAALKKGETPAGFKIEKESEKEAPKTTETQKGQEVRKITPPPPVSHVELGKLEKARPMTTEAQKGQEAREIPTPPSLPSLSKPTINIPPMGGFLGRLKGRPDFKRIVFYIIAGIAGFIITAFLVPYFVSLPAVSISPTHTATPTRTTTSIPPSLSQILGNLRELIRIPTSENPYSILKNYLDIHTTMPLDFGQKIPLGIINDETGEEYSLTDLFNRFQIHTPNGFVGSLDSNEWTFLFYGQGEKFDDEGLLLQSISFLPKIAFISKVRDPISLKNTLNVWDTTITNDLQKLFNLDTEKAISETLLNNIYKGVTIKYRNFPFADNTIDYSLIDLPKFNVSYFVLTNSRESMYSIIDILQNL